jgi:hypothetical protein
VSATRRDEPAFSTSAQAFVVTGGDAYLGTRLVAIDNAAKGYMVNRQLCTDGASIPLVPAGLPRTDVLAPGRAYGRQYRCLREGKIALRVRLTQDRKGVPVKAQIAVRMATTGRPVLYADWSPRRVIAWASPSCTASDF